MGARTQQSFAKLKDLDLTIATSPTTDLETEWMIIYHSDLALDAKPVLTVDTTPVVLGDVGSNEDYEIKRMSGGQTIIRKTIPGVVTVHVSNCDIVLPPEVHRQVIGQARIGESFIIA